MNDDAEPVDKDDPPTSFTAFKPVGQVVVGLVDDDAAKRAADALAQAGFDAGAIVRYRADEMRRSMSAMLDASSGSAEFGHEIVVMRKYVDLATEGCGWLVVPAKESEDQQRVLDVVQPLGVRMAVRYGLLVIEELV